MSIPASRPSPRVTAPPVERGALFRGTALELHDNVCRRRDAGVSEETAPLEFHELVFPRSGIWMRHRGRDAIVVDACRAHLFARGDSHRVSHPAGCGDRNTGIALTDAALAAVDPRAQERGRFALAAVPVDGRAYAEHCALVDGLRRGRLDPLEAEERALALAAQVLAAARGERRRLLDRPPRSFAVRRRHRELALEAQRLLAARPRDRLGLGELAATLDVSVYHLCRVFRAEVGTTMHAYRRSLRVRLALRLLGDPGLTLYDVAERSGFADRCQLSRAVRAAVGRPPTSFRERLEQDPTRAAPRPS